MLIRFYFNGCCIKIVILNWAGTIVEITQKTSQIDNNKMPNPDLILDGEPFFTVYHTVYRFIVITRICLHGCQNNFSKERKSYKKISLLGLFFRGLRAAAEPFQQLLMHIYMIV